DHQRDQILDGEDGARIEALNDAGARTDVIGDKRVLVRQLEAARFDPLERFDHQGDLDRAHRLHLAVGIDRDLFARVERLDVNPPGRVDALRGPFDRRAQALQRRFGRRLPRSLRIYDRREPTKDTEDTRNPTSAAPTARE